MAGMDKIGQCIKIGLADPPIQWLDSFSNLEFSIEEYKSLLEDFESFRNKF